jgi:hypothetical protein
MAEETTNEENIFSNKGTFSIPQVDTSGVDAFLNKLQTPASTGVYDRLEAMYRDKSIGDVLRRQKNIALLFQPSFELYKQRKNAADQAFAKNLENSPEVDDTYIFGELNGTAMPITAEIKSLSDIIRTDLRALSNLNPTDPRYVELRKKVENNQGQIVKFNELNKKLLEIRNSEMPNIDEWANMKKEEVEMWKAIKNSDGSQIKIKDNKIVFVGTNGKEIDLNTIGDTPTVKNNKAAVDYQTLYNSINNYALTGAGVDDAQFAGFFGGNVNFLKGFTDDAVRSLVFDGYDFDVSKGDFGPNTKEFLDEQIAKIDPSVLDENLSEEERANKIENAIETLKSYGINEKIESLGNKSIRELFIESETSKFYEMINLGKGVQSMFRKNEQGGLEIIDDNKKRKIKKKPKKDQDDNKVGPSSLELSDDLLELPDNVTDLETGTNVSEIYSNLNADNLKDIFKLRDVSGKYILERLLPEGFEVKPLTGVIGGFQEGPFKEIAQVYYNGKLLTELVFENKNEEIINAQANKLIKAVKEKTGVDIPALLGSASATEQQEDVELEVEITDNNKIYGPMKQDGKDLPGNQAIRPKKLLQALAAVDVTSYDDINEFANNIESNSDKIKKLSNELKKSKYNVNISEDFIDRYLKMLVKQIK